LYYMASHPPPKHFIYTHRCENLRSSVKVFG
jgi:hypothetical protein